MNLFHDALLAVLDDAAARSPVKVTEDKQVRCDQCGGCGLYTHDHGLTMYRYSFHRCTNCAGTGFVWTEA